MKLFNRHQDDRHPDDLISNAAPVSTPQLLAAQQGMDELLAGNLRFVDGKVINPHQDSARRAEVLAGQSPFAVVLSCADSRVPPEILFDQGIGDIFVVRTAGNVVDDITLGTIEYAVEHLHVPLIVVMGHQKCGAVQAAVKGGQIPGHIAVIVDEIMPAVKEARSIPGDKVASTIDINVKNVVEKLQASEPILKEFVEGGKLRIIGARYDMDSGKVMVLEARKPEN